jgi:hypothetical protein
VQSSLGEVPLLRDVLVLRSHERVVLELLVLLSTSLPLLSVVAVSTLLDVVVPLVLLVALVLVHDGLVLVPPFAFELCLLAHVAGSRM